MHLFAASSARPPETVHIPVGSYIGQVASTPGHADYHLFLMESLLPRATWEAATSFAASLGGFLPSSTELLLLEQDGKLSPGAYWTSDRHVDGWPVAGLLPIGALLPIGTVKRSDPAKEFIARVVRRDPVGHADDWSAPPDQATTALPPAAAGAVTAEALLDAELWPADSELLAAIHELFLHTWGMHAGQADARMGRFNYQAARAALEGGAA